MKTLTTENIGETCDATNSAVAWPSIIAGALTAATVSLILLLLGSGLGFASVSPWVNSGVTLTTFTVTAAIWLIAMQWISSGIGGYLTGRLRSKWASVYRDEVFFRDTAHGFLAWALATLITAVLLASAASSVIGGGVGVATTVTASAAAGAGYSATDNYKDTMGDLADYLVDGLYRSSDPKPYAVDYRGETMRILSNGIKRDRFNDTDRAYLTQLVVARTGLKPMLASERVENALSSLTAVKEKAKEDLEAARKTATQVSLYTFLSLLVGAFIACTAAALGGRHRDEY